MNVEKAVIDLGCLSAPEKKLVREVLRSILDSHHFCKKSHRYPALLEYVVLNALEGNSSQLKERNLGVEVLGRSADYDSSNDPVVRIAIREVRRRLALYYVEHPESPVYIDIPLGSYIPELCFHSLSSNEHSDLAISTNSDTSITIADPDKVSSAVKKSGIRRRSAGWTIAISAVAVLALCFSGWMLWKNNSDRSKRDLWYPFLQSEKPLVVLMGASGRPIDGVTALQRLVNPGAITAGKIVSESNASTFAPATLDAKQTAMGDSVAGADICGVLSSYRRDCNIISVDSATLEDLRRSSVVLIGGGNNIWTLRLLEKLRYQFHPRPSDPTLEHGSWTIIDHDNPGKDPFRQTPDASQKHGSEYAIIARFHSDITDGMILIVAGMGPEGTQGAAEFIRSSTRWEEIFSRAPENWKGLNFEAVLQVDILDGVTGHARVTDVNFW
jgi:hypothetical protein